ncbi:MAG: TadE/TadG family type IV pilus assembly protein [Pseudomonadota bacterium]
MKKLLRFIVETRAATLVEFSFIAPLLFVITFGVAELGYFYFQYQALDAATRMGARIAATRGPAITGMPDCGVAVATSPGNYCSATGAGTQWSATCTGTALTTSGGAVAVACDAAIMGRILQEMRLVYPSLAQNNIVVTFSGSKLGFVGKGRPVPLVTVEVAGVTASLPVLSAFGIGPFLMPSFSTSLPGEDLAGT